MGWWLVRRIFAKWILWFNSVRFYFLFSTSLISSFNRDACMAVCCHDSWIGSCQLLISKDWRFMIESAGGWLRFPRKYRFTWHDNSWVSIVFPSLSHWVLAWLWLWLYFLYVNHLPTRKWLTWLRLNLVMVVRHINLNNE